MVTASTPFGTSIAATLPTTGAESPGTETVSKPSPTTPANRRVPPASMPSGIAPAVTRTSRSLHVMLLPFASRTTRQMVSSGAGTTK
jgi:hypothetical protein